VAQCGVDATEIATEIATSRFENMLGLLFAIFIEDNQPDEIGY
jgi:hypothetical protein